MLSKDLKSNYACFEQVKKLLESEADEKTLKEGLLYIYQRLYSYLESKKLCYHCQHYYIDRIDGEFCCKPESMYFYMGWTLDGSLVPTCNMFCDGEPMHEGREDWCDREEEFMKIVHEAIEIWRRDYDDPSIQTDEE